MDEIKNKQLVLEELRRAFEKKFSANNILDGKLQNILNFLSIVVSVAPTLQLMIVPDLNKMGFVFLALLLSVVILYFVSFRRIVAAIDPVYYRQPISKGWDELAERYFHSAEEKAIDITISEYLYSLDDLGKQHDKKIRTIHKASDFMALIVILLLLAIPVNLFFPNPTLMDIGAFISQLLR